VDGVRWEAALARAAIGGDEWYGYAYWMRDEADDPAGSDALLWLIRQEKYPCLYDSKTWLWVSPRALRVMVMGRHREPPPYCVLPQDVYDALVSRVNVFETKHYRTRVAAMLAAVSAAAACGKRPEANNGKA
jgi:hypothetical protein